ncbi:MAG: DUF1684 domain-containing protein [bacterium]|nr:DUF1684 domain-containing protein [bacterium]
MKQKKTIISIVILITLAAVFMQAAATREKPQASQKTKWQQDLLKERKEKDDYYKTSPTSPMAGVKRFTIAAKTEGKTYIVNNGKTLLLSSNKEPGAMLSIALIENKWVWQPVPGNVTNVTCKTGDKEVKAGSPIPAGTVLFKIDRYCAAAYSGKERIALLVFDPKRPQIKEFSHLYYFKPNYNYVVTATVQKFAKIEKVKILTNRNEEKTYYRYARLLFQLDGKALELTALKFSIDKNNPLSKYFFIPYNDATNDAGTYAAGRFLDILDSGESTVTIDFNYSYNPLCNYAPVYNCPMPPLENNLAVAIKAGEKTYPH